MRQSPFCGRASLRGLLLGTATVIVLSAAPSGQASTDGLAIRGTPPTTATMGQAYSFTPTVSDPAKRALQFVIWNKPSWATFNTASGRLAGTPSAANVGQISYVTIFVTDGVARASLAQFTLSVHASAADKPTISGTPPTRVAVGQNYSFTPSVSNPGKLALHFGIWNQPSWATFNSSTGRLSGTPAAANAGKISYVTVYVTDGVDRAFLPQFTLTVTGAAPASSTDKPVISGTPATSVIAGSTYKFQPTAKDPGGKSLSFSVQNKPSWASFSIASGLLDGTPTSSQTGSYNNIIVSASNGQSSSALPAFSVTVKSATSGTTGAATLNWVPPTTDTKGDPLTGLAGIRIYYGTSPSKLAQMVQVAGASASSATIGNLTAGTWYFGGVAYTTAGAQSAMTGIVSKYIP
jgi:hypothetical protein